MIDVTDAAAFETSDRVTVAMCTYNGAQYLDEQLQSLLDQTHKDWDLWVSDDGSTDATLAKLDAFADRCTGRHSVTIVKGPQRGASENFLSLLHHPDLPTRGLVALSDQDDIWHPHKLARAVDKVAPTEGPVLYGAQSIHKDKDGRTKGRSRSTGRQPTFANALAQNVISGHSSVLNPAALAIVRRAPTDLPHHDWWIYQLIANSGGTIIRDTETVLTYRQHDSNVMGAHNGLRASILRYWQVFNGTYGEWVSANLTALRAMSNDLTPAARDLLDALAATPRRLGFRRARVFMRFGIVRQSRFQTYALWAAVALGRV